MSVTNDQIVAAYQMVHDAFEGAGHPVFVSTWVDVEKLDVPIIGGLRTHMVAGRQFWRFEIATDTDAGQPTGPGRTAKLAVLEEINRNGKQVRYQWLTYEAERILLLIKRIAAHMHHHHTLDGFHPDVEWPPASRLVRWQSRWRGYDLRAA